MSLNASPQIDDMGVSRSALPKLARRVRQLLADRSDTAIAQKVAGSAFLIRVVNAGIAFLSQILLARWMGESEYGVYVYVWTWVLLLGGLSSLGLASAPQRFIPQYAESGEHSLLRGFLVGSRLIAMTTTTAIAGVGLLCLWLFSKHLEQASVVPLYLAVFCLPLFVLTDVQDGIARSHNWIDVALAPAYFVRPLLILLLLGVLSYERFAPDATTAMAATIVATWVTGVAQLTMLELRLRKRVPAGPRRYAPSLWMKVSLPIFMVEGFYLLLAYTDVLLLSAFRPPQEVGIYYAAVKIMSLVAFVSFSVSAAVAHRFTEYAVSGERGLLATMVRDAARWTFWPSLAGATILLALGWPFLLLFGPAFTAGYPLLFIMAIGLLARACVGPLERLLNMLGQQNICAAIYAGAFALNVVLCLALAPSYGMWGVAIATSVTMVIESALLFSITRRRLGLGALPWSSAPVLTSASRPTDAPVNPFAPGAAVCRFELVDIATLARHAAAWRDLAQRAIEPNLFCEADFASAAGHLSTMSRVRMAVVWSSDGGAPRMLAVAAVVPRHAGLIRMHASTQWSFFGPLGTPLLDKDLAEIAAEALLAGLQKAGDGVFLFRFLSENGPAAMAIRAAAEASGRAMTRISGHGRAVLRSDVPAEELLTSALSSKKLKELRRQLRRLADDGAVEFREHRSAVEVAAGVDRYLELEARGWKGQNNSAMRDHADQLAFIHALFASRAAEGQARVLELVVDGTIVASGLVVITGRQAWFYKIAYDESRSKCSPGVQLTIELTKRLIEDPAIDAVDSTAVANHPMIDHIWRDRLAIGDWMIALRPRQPRLLALAVLAETSRRRARVIVRDMYHRLKDRSR